MDNSSKLYSVGVHFVNHGDYHEVVNVRLFKSSKKAEDFADEVREDINMRMTKYNNEIVAVEKEREKTDKDFSIFWDGVTSRCQVPSDLLFLTFDKNSPPDEWSDNIEQFSTECRKIEETQGLAAGLEYVLKKHEEGFIVNKIVLNPLYQDMLRLLSGGIIGDHLFYGKDDCMTVSIKEIDADLGD